MRLLYYFGLAIVVVIIDQWSKWLIVKYMQVGQSIEIVPNLLYLTSHRNKGAAWGMLQGQLWLFYILTVIVVIGIIYYMVKYGKDKTLQSIGFSFILGGAIGNFLDRFFRKEVVDFIHTYIFHYDFPIFNFADSSLTIGVVILIIALLLEDRRERQKANGTN